MINQVNSDCCHRHISCSNCSTRL